MRTSNPALSDKTFKEFFSQARVAPQERMTIGGTVHKSFLLVAITLVGALFSWQTVMPQGELGVPTVPVWYIPAAIGGFVLALVIIFKKTMAPILSPVYAGVQGLVLGAISALFEAQYQGIVLQAILCTVGTFLALLLAYQSKLIRATENFKLGVVAATGGIALVYLIDLGLNFFGMRVPYIHESGPLGIGISFFIVVIAALNLVLDFDFIEKGAEHGAPKFMEWYGAFGLLVTLIWLYLEILRLLAKTRKK